MVESELGEWYEIKLANGSIGWIDDQACREDMNFLNWLLTLDTELFLFLNGLHTPFLDPIMYYISKVWIWIPLYAGVVAFIIKKWKMESIWIILSFILCVVLTDQLANLVKLVVERVRPSREPELAGMVHHVKGYLSGGFSFVSDMHPMYSDLPC